MRDCLAPGAVVTAGDCRPSLPHATSHTDPAQLAAGRAHRDRERPRRSRHRPGRRALRRPPGRRALRRRRRGPPRAPGAAPRARGVVAAGPRYIARVADFDDTGEARAAGTAGGWQAVEWDLSARSAINAPGAWTAAAAPGARGWPGRQGRGGRHRRGLLPTGLRTGARPTCPPSACGPATTSSPTIASPTTAAATGRSSPATIAAAADNHFGMVGVAYGADIMPVRVLDSLGEGAPAPIASRRPLRRRPRRAGHQPLGRVLRPAQRRPRTITSSPDVRDADPLRRRAPRPVVVAAGNSSEAEIPSRVLDDSIIYVGATTEHGCLADYSNFGRGVDLVAPGRRRRRVAAQRPQLRAGRRRAGATSRRSASRARRYGDFRIRARPAGADRAEGHVDGRAPRHRRRRPAARSQVLGARPDAAADRQRRLTDTARDLGRPAPRPLLRRGPRRRRRRAARHAVRLAALASCG